MGRTVAVTDGQKCQRAVEETCRDILRGILAESSVKGIGQYELAEDYMGLCYNTWLKYKKESLLQMPIGALLAGAGKLGLKITVSVEGGTA